jgi:hypothetical protein
MTLGYNEPYPRSVGSFQRPVAPPDADPDDGAIMTVCFNAAWLPFILGALQQLTLQATWEGDAATILLAQDRAQLLLAMFGSGGGSCDSCMTVCGILYDADTDQIKQTYDGGGTYVPNPGQDPRHADQFRYPVVGGTDPECTAAGNMANFFQALISNIETALTVSSAVTGLTAFALPFFLELGPFAVFFELVDALCAIAFTAGHAALEVAFTDATYDTLTCIFFCHTDANGQVSGAALADIKSDIAAQLTTVGSDVMQACLLLMGEVGLSNAGTQGESTRDCSACGCCWYWVADMTTSDNGWGAVIGGDDLPRATYVPGVGWSSIYFPPPNDNSDDRITATLPRPVHFTAVRVTFTGGSDEGTGTLNGAVLGFTSGEKVDCDVTTDELRTDLSNSGNNPLNISMIEWWGDGAKPLGAVNVDCP